MRAAAALYLPVLLIVIFAREDGGFKTRPIERAQIEATHFVNAELSADRASASDYISLKGRFKADFTGSRSGTLSGDAVIVSERGNGTVIHNTALYACEGEATCRVIQFSRLREQLPATGTYPLDGVDARDEIQALYYETTSGKLTLLCAPSEGALKITLSDPERLAGSFDFTASEMIGQTSEGGQPVQVQIAGSFEAHRADKRDLPAGLQ